MGWISRTSSDFQEAILGLLHWKVAEPGVQISRAGDQHGGLVGIAQGIVEISAEIDHPDTRFVHLAGAGFWVGYRPLIGKSRNLTLTARTELLWALAPQRAVEKVLNDNPHYWRHIAELIDLGYETALEAVIDLTRHDGLSRLAATLLRLSGCRHDHPAILGPSELRISQSDLAGISVMSRNTVGAHLSKLVQLGLVEVDYRSIRIIEPDRLRALLSKAD
jgi:CRP-like cAMP-binding protein